MFEVDFAKQGGLVPVIVQDADDGTVLMLAYMNELALTRTIETAADEKHAAFDKSHAGHGH